MLRVNQQLVPHGNCAQKSDERSATFSLPRPTSNPRLNVFASSASSQSSCAISSTTGCPSGAPLLIDVKATGASAVSTREARTRESNDEEYQAVPHACLLSDALPPATERAPPRFSAGMWVGDVSRTTWR